MDFYNAIKNLNQEQIDELISLRIAQEKYKSSQNHKRFIGIDCGINPSLTLVGEKELDSQAMWNGFIPEDVKIIYSFVPNEQGYTVNNGCYYYMDTEDYIYEFAKFIKTKDVQDEIEFLAYVYQFIDNYFNNLANQEIHRKIMHQPLIGPDGKYIEPTSGHLFSEFKASNNAECSEYSAMAQNILSVFEYPMIYFGGSVNSAHGRGGHAFNFTLINKMACVIDFTIPVEMYSLDGKYLGLAPFIGSVKDFSTETLKKHLLEYIPYNFREYYFVVTEEQFMMITNGNTRNYIVGNVEYFNEKNLKKSKQ